MHVEREMPQFLREQVLRAVLRALALAQDHRALRVRLLRVEGGVSHPLGLDH